MDPLRAALPAEFKDKLPARLQLGGHVAGQGLLPAPVDPVEHSIRKNDVCLLLQLEGDRIPLLEGQSGMKGPGLGHHLGGVVHPQHPVSSVRQLLGQGPVAAPQIHHQASCFRLHQLQHDLTAVSYTHLTLPTT